jgi:hypothetical protein
VAGGSNAVPSDSVWQFRRTSNINTLSKSSLEAAFQTNIALNVVAALNARYAQTLTTVRWVNDAYDKPTSTTRAIAGSIAGECMPTSLSVFFLGRTAFRGGIHRGSKKLFPLSEADTTLATADLWNAAALARFATIAAAWLAGFTDGNGNVWKPVVLSRKKSSLSLNPTTVYVTDINEVAVNKRVGRMKKRMVASVY